MKKLIFMLMTVLLTASLLGVSLADDDAEHPVPAWTDEHVRNMNLFGSSDIGEYEPSKRNEDADVSEKMHPKAQYRITKWTPKGEQLILEIEDRNGKKDVLIGVRKTAKETLPENGRLVNLKNKIPLQFAVPEWVEVVHVWKDKGHNFEITSEGNKELPVKGNGKMAYPGKTVLVDKGNTMTVWLLQ